jgi:microcystin degradation protein MlrC
MKLFLSTLYQETNSFSPCPTNLDQFRREKLSGGSAVLDEIRGTNLELAGMVEEIGRRFPGAAVVPGFYAWSVASGPVTDAAFAQITELMLAPLRRALPVDAVLLSMHGSLGRETGDDCEGEILARIRDLVGPGIPIAVALDSHAAVTGLMLGHADLLCGYRTYPHVDMAETGRRTVVALAAWLAGGRREKAVVRHWPAVIPVDNAQTDAGPMAQLMTELVALESDPGVLTVSAFGTHPWFDTADCGVTLVAYAPMHLAAKTGERLDQLLRQLWERRHEFISIGPEADEFFRRLSEWPGPIAAIDAGDVTTAGAPGDSTVMLRAALAAPGPKVLIPLVDSTAVAQAFAAGTGRTAEFTAGGAEDHAAYNARLSLRAKVLRLTSDPLQLKGAAFGGISLPLGPRALLQAGMVRLLVLSHASLFHDPELWRCVGEEPAKADVIVQKSHKLFRPAYAPMVGSVVTVDTRGCTDRRLSRLPYRRIRRPVFPLDPVNQLVTTTLA